MSLTQEDLDALERTEKEIRALSVASPETVRLPLLRQSEEYAAAVTPPTPATPENDDEPLDCATPVFEFTTCRGVEHKCPACSVRLTGLRVLSATSQPDLMCPHGCGKRFAECCQFVGQIRK